MSRKLMIFLLPLLIGCQPKKPEVRASSRSRILFDAELIGGRHCSIASVPAVMLRYRVGADVIGICQARFDPARHRGVPDMQVAAAPATAMARGLKVSLCHDRGVLMAMASA